MNTQTAQMQTTVVDRISDPAEEAARRLYNAEVALHAAHASRVDAWIAAAADRLHEAIQAHLAAQAAVASGER